MDPTPFLHAAADRALLKLPLTVSELEGNSDRRSDQKRVHLHVRDAAERNLKITIGHGLELIRQRADAFHAALPFHSSPTAFFLSINGVDVWAQEWIPGPCLEQPLTGIADAVRTILALETLESALESTATASSPAAWQEEFDEFARTVLELSIWDPAEISEMKRLLPRLATELRASTTPRIRWSNGDFLPANIKLAPEKEPVLLDIEYGRRTHFFPEDRIRFSRLSRLALTHPGLFAGIWPQTDPAWEIFFWLRQLILETSVNSPAYLAREVRNRKESVYSAAQSLEFNFSQGSDILKSPHLSAATETVQLFWDIDGNWNEVRSARIEVPRGRWQFIAFRLPPNAHQLRLDPASSVRTIHFKSLSLLDCDGSLTPLFERFTAVGTDIRLTAEGISLSPHHADPQLLIHSAVQPSFLVAEISVTTNE